jgi:hypothetical protein
LRVYRITIETEDGSAEDSAAVDRTLEALERIPTVENPSVDREYPKTVGRQGVRFAFTLQAEGMDEAGTIARQLFGQATGEAALTVAWEVIETDEGPPLDETA